MIVEHKNIFTTLAKHEKNSGRLREIEYIVIVLIARLQEDI